MTTMSTDRGAERRRRVLLKEQNPGMFCKADGCLSPTTRGPCPFHPIGRRVRITRQGSEDFGKFGTVDRAAGPFLWVVIEDDGEEVKVPNDWAEVL
jgi:hypothetical protein